MEQPIKDFALNLKQTGTQVAFNFPGFHSSLLFNEFTQHIISTNESVAYASAWGASQAGKMALVCFRELGLNVAADNYINSLFTGIGSGLVVVIFSDSKFEGSQCIIDIYNYARFGGAWLRPYDYYSFIFSSKIANLISSSFDLPVVIEISNTIDFSKKDNKDIDIEAVKDIIKKYSAQCNQKNKPISHPINSYSQFNILYKKQKKLILLANEINKMIGGDFLVAYPIEDHRILPIPKRDNYIISTRYEKIFREVKKNFHYICGDIGEFTADTLNTITHALNLGSSIAVAMGMTIAGKKNVVAIIGDGAFFHSAKNSIDELIGRQLDTKIILIDNGGLYSTGGQKIFGVIPPYIKKIELDFHTKLSNKKIQEVVDNFYLDPQIMLLKINFRI